MSGEGIFAGECDRLKVELQQSEQLRQEAFQACETMRLQVADKQRQSQVLMRERDDRTAQLQDAVQRVAELQAQLAVAEGRVDQLREHYEVAKQNRDEWKASAEYQQQQATQLRLQVEALEASVDQVQEWNKTLQQQASDLQAQLDAAKNEASKTGWVYVGSHLPNREQLDTEIVRLTNNWGREIDERKALQQQVADLQAQLEAAAVTSTQQPDGNAAERLDRVRRMVGHVLGWYTCTDWFDEVERADAWEHVGELLGRLQREAG